jgi:integrase/recombinase XerC
MDLDKYRVYMEASGYSAGTARMRIGYVTRYLGSLNGTDPSGATVSDVAMFLATPGWAPSTKASARSSVSSFHAWLIAEGLAHDNPVHRVKPIRIPPSVAKLCPETAYERALEDAESAGDARAVLVLLLAGMAGLRRNEIASLRCEHVTERGLRVTGKGGRTRLVPIHPVLAEPLRLAAESGSGWLFPAADPEHHIHARTINRIVNRYLPNGMSTHSMRHRFATMVHQGSRDLRAVQELLGHTSLATTQRYVSVSEDDLTMAVGSLQVMGRERV